LSKSAKSWCTTDLHLEVWRRIHQHSGWMHLCRFIIGSECVDFYMLYDLSQRLTVYFLCPTSTAHALRRDKLKENNLCLPFKWEENGSIKG
jgi:hypothetical protein